MRGTCCSVLCCFEVPSSMKPLRVKQARSIWESQIEPGQRLKVKARLRISWVESIATPLSLGIAARPMEVRWSLASILLIVAFNRVGGNFDSRDDLCTRVGTCPGKSKAIITCPHPRSADPDAIGSDSRRFCREKAFATSLDGKIFHCPCFCQLAFLLFSGVLSSN